MSEWVDVNVQLPVENEIVVVLCADASFMMNFQNKTGWHLPMDDMVTHWLQLPPLHSNMK